MSWQIIIDRGLENQTNAEIVEALEPLTKYGIGSDIAKEFLRNNLIWFESGKNTMSGVIEDNKANLSVEAQGYIGLLYSALWAENASIRSDISTYAVMVKTVLGELLAGLHISQAIVDEWYALAGGKLFPGVDEATVASWKTAYDAEEVAKETQRVQQVGQELIYKTFSDWRSAFDAANKITINEEQAKFNQKLWHWEAKDFSGMSDAEITQWYIDLNNATDQSGYPA